MKVYQNSEDQNINPLCNICGKQTFTKETLKQHQDAVHKSKGLECAECNQIKSKSQTWKKLRTVQAALADIL